MEILGLIFENLSPSTVYNKRDTLGAMKTCKSMHFSGLPYLYRDIIIKTFVARRSFSEILQTRGTLVHRLRVENEDDELGKGTDTQYRANLVQSQIALVLELVAAHCPNLRTLFLADVRGFKLGELSEYSRVGSLEGQVNKTFRLHKNLEVLFLRSATVNSSLGMMFGMLVRLKKLYVSKSDDLADGDLAQLVLTSPHLRELYLNECQKLTVDGLIHCVSSFSKLDILHLEEFYFYRNERRAVHKEIEATVRIIEALARHRCLRTLRLHRVSLIHVLPELSTDSFPRLRVLDLSFNYDSSLCPFFTNLPTFLGNLPALQVLHLDREHICLGDGRLICDVLPPTVKVYTFVRRVVSSPVMQYREGRYVSLDPGLDGLEEMLLAVEDGRLFDKDRMESRAGWPEFEDFSEGWKYGIKKEKEFRAAMYSMPSMRDSFIGWPSQ